MSLARLLKLSHCRLMVCDTSLRYVACSQAVLLLVHCLVKPLAELGIHPRAPEQVLINLETALG